MRTRHRRVRQKSGLPEVGGENELFACVIICPEVQVTGLRSQTQRRVSTIRFTFYLAPESKSNLFGLTAMTHDRLRRCFWLVILIALLHLGVHAQQSCTPPPHGMVGWWSGDGNYKDLVGGKDGTPIGSMTFGTGEVGQAFSLDGTNSIRAADSPALNLGAGEITLDAWIKAPPYNGVNDVLYDCGQEQSFLSLSDLFPESTGRQ